MITPPRLAKPTRNQLAIELDIGIDLVVQIRVGRAIAIHVSHVRARQWVREEWVFGRERNVDHHDDDGRIALERNLRHIANSVGVQVVPYVARNRRQHRAIFEMLSPKPVGGRASTCGFLFVFGLRKEENQFGHMEYQP